MNSVCLDFNFKIVYILSKAMPIARQTDETQCENRDPTITAYSTMASDSSTQQKMHAVMNDLELISKLVLLPSHYLHCCSIDITSYMYTI